jgi:WD40 repeat protein
VDYTARLWNARTGATQAILRGHQGPVNAVAASPDGQLLASASGDGTARLWDGETGDALVTADEHEGAVVHLELDTAALRLLTVGGTGDGTARVWWLPPRGSALLDLARRLAQGRGLTGAERRLLGIDTP